MESQITDQSVDQDNQYIGSLIHDGFYDKLVLIGFPYDIGAIRCGAKKGQDYGPDSFRRFVKNIGSLQNPEYGIDISKGLPKISDYGNIQIAPLNGKRPSQKELQDKLTQKVSLCIQRQKMPLVIGGTRDQFCALSNAIMSQNQGQKCLFIIFRKTLDLEEVKLSDIDQEPELNQKNSLRHVLSHDSFRTHHRAMVIGLQNVTKEERDIFITMNPSGQIVTAEELRSQKPVNHKPKGCLTQAGQLISQIIEQTNSDSTIDQIYISISMEGIEGVVGVSTPCVAGITSEEAIEVLMTSANLSKKLVAVDISDYNPFIEDWSTGRMVATMFYYFALGMSAQIQHQNLY